MLDHWTWTKRVVRPSPRAIRSATSTSKPRTCDGSAGSASTNGAPPSASPPHTSTRAVGCCTASAVRMPSARLTTAHQDAVELNRMVLPSRSARYVFVLLACGCAAAPHLERGRETVRCASRFPPTLSLRSRKIAEARVAIQMHECLGRANARLTTAPLRHDLVMLPPNALTILADMRKQRGLFFLDR